MFNDESYRNAVLGRSERLRAERESTSEFDQVFEDLESPDYPATCDQCGMEGTNASMAGHECASRTSVGVWCNTCGVGNYCNPVNHNEPPAPRAGERERWHVSKVKNDVRVAGLRVDATEIYVEGGRADWCAQVLRPERAQQIVSAMNQHATLIEQRKRLLRLLRPVTSPTACYCAMMRDEKCWHCEARELIATIEREEVQ